jgi:Phage integrase, N-terminal SAM-like domain
MSDETISPLRRRMIEDMTVRGIGEKTRNDYIRHVRTFSAFLGRAPDTATADGQRRFQLFGHSLSRTTNAARKLEKRSVQPGARFGPRSLPPPLERRIVGR